MIQHNIYYIYPYKAFGCISTDSGEITILSWLGSGALAAGNALADVTQTTTANGRAAFISSDVIMFFSNQQFVGRNSENR